MRSLTCSSSPRPRPPGSRTVGGALVRGTSLPKRVLVVEDDATIRDTLSFNLKKEGYLVTVAIDGADGLSRARDSRPDLILLDLMLPELSGLEICRILRQEGNVPIIMLTAKESEVDKLRSEEHTSELQSHSDLVCRLLL